MGQFVNPTQIYWGEDIQKRLQQFQYKKVMIVCDGFLLESSQFRKYLEVLEKTNTLELFSEIVPDPPLEKVMLGAKNYLKFLPEVVIAIGGGSALDTAKAICYFSQHIIEQEKIPFIAVPTTSGTGSEVTGVAVVTDLEKGMKYPIVSSEIIPNEAWLDVEFVKSCPKQVIAHSGLDVLTHALEALVAQQATSFTDSLAIQAIGMVFDYLVKTYQDKDDVESFIKMQEASCLAGMAFQQAGLGICHAISHQLGGLYHLPHGLLNSLLLPKVIQLNSQDTVAFDKYTRCTKQLGLANQSDNQEETLQRLLQKIADLILALECDTSLEKLGINKKNLIENLPLIIERTQADFTFSGNPLKPKVEELIEIVLTIK